MNKEREWVTLSDFVESLLKIGKKSVDEEFQTLFRVYGKDKIVALAKEILNAQRGDACLVRNKTNSAQGKAQ